MSGIANALQKPLKELDEEVENEVIQLCLAIAKQMIRREINLDSGHIISMVREALAALPVASQQVHISVHAEDAVVVRRVLVDSNQGAAWNIVNDVTLSRGGCKVVTEYSQIDATLETRMGKIAAKILGNDRSNDKYK